MEMLIKAKISKLTPEEKAKFYYKQALRDFSICGCEWQYYMFIVQDIYMLGNILGYDEDKIYADIEIAKNKKEKQIKSPYRDYINFIYTREDEKQWIPVQKQ